MTDEPGELPRAEAPRPAATRPARQATRPLLWIGLALLVGLCAVALVVTAVRPASEVDPAAPEATVQRFLEALADERLRDAEPTFTDELAEQCRNELRGDYRYLRVDRVELLDVAIAPSPDAAGRRTATVDVAVTRAGEGPFDLGSGTSTERFVLTEVDAGWRIAEAPWPLYGCWSGVKEPPVGQG